MAPATIINTKYGYLVGGVGTDPTTITTQTVKIKAVVCTAVASAATALLSEVVFGGAGTAQRLVIWASPVNLTETFDMHGVRADGLIATLGATGTRLAIITE